MIRRPPRSTLFPYTDALPIYRAGLIQVAHLRQVAGAARDIAHPDRPGRDADRVCEWEVDPAPDRKSTRLNSSHTVISYAVFCLKKKKTQLANVINRTR